ncbi:redoxin domain-containing protein [Peribacillus frigoritolerans]|uniref:redoxin domain-containing protein n=1 Tax=Peribacillus frigoritolerans TaxID=450367 RepID=UPI002EC414F2|nr:redoxin domain-containing protein [Peribacillus frigoritolerans]
MPYCNLELKAYQRELDSIKDSSTTLIAISPETPDATLSTKEKDELEFIVFSNEGNNVAEQFDLVFKMPNYLIEIYKDSGLDVPGHNGNDNCELTKSTTFVIDQSGKIVQSVVHRGRRSQTYGWAQRTIVQRPSSPTIKHY